MLSEGDRVEPFQAKLDDGSTFNLEDYKGKNLVLYFYPKDFTPGCTKEACSFRDSHSEFKEEDIPVVGVSVDSVESHQKFKKEHRLQFPLISDEKKEIVKQFGVKNLFGMAKRVTFWIGPELEIKKVWQDVTPSDHPEEILKEIKG